MRSVMQKNFGRIARADIQRSSFNRSHGYKTTFDEGLLIPVFIDEILPGDVCNVKMNHFARLATPIVPVMDNAYLDSHFFFVPTRLVWDNWQRFNGEQDDPDDSTDFLTPIMTSPVGGYTENTIFDYFGLPTKIAGLSHISLPFRCYNLIWNEWFRDQNLQNSVFTSRADTADDPVNYKLLRRGKRHDYFTSCLPWPQKGPAVELPLGTSAPVYGADQTLGTGYNLWQTMAPSNNRVGTVGVNWNATGTARTLNAPNLAGATNTPANIGDQFSLAKKADYDNPLFSGSEPPYADLSQATASTINQLRQAFQIQRLYERDARGGTRYTEIIRSHFGVISPDARLQRPEYLGGGSTPVNIHPVPQTSESGAETPQGNLAAFGTSSGRTGRFTKGFTEHGYIIGLISVRADLTYQQGLDRMWSRRRRFDYYWPALSHLGEQAVLNKEIYADGTADDDKVFGYQEPWAEMRFKQSRLTGLFRSNATGSLDVWHWSQDFNSTPTLSAQFIEENAPFERTIAVENEPHFILDAYFNYIHSRPLPTYGTPGMIDHF